MDDAIHCSHAFGSIIETFVFVLPAHTHLQKTHLFGCWLEMVTVLNRYGEHVETCLLFKMFGTKRSMMTAINFEYSFHVCFRCVSRLSCFFFRH